MSSVSDLSFCRRHHNQQSSYEFAQCAPIQHLTRLSYSSEGQQLLVVTTSCQVAILVAYKTLAMDDLSSLSARRVVVWGSVKTIFAAAPRSEEYL